MLKKLGKKSTAKLYYTSDGVQTECTDKFSMEEACIAENTAQFSQTEATPPMTKPLVTNLGYLADTEAAQRILDDTYEIPEDLDQRLLYLSKNPGCLTLSGILPL
jgi:hypothetical protein